jgi:hypothetical protein
MVLHHSPHIPPSEQHSGPVAGSKSILEDSLIARPNSSIALNNPRFGLEKIDAEADSAAGLRHAALESLLESKENVKFATPQGEIVIQRAPHHSGYLISVSHPGKKPNWVVNTTFQFDTTGHCPTLSDGGHAIDEFEIAKINGAVVTLSLDPKKLPALQTSHDWLDRCHTEYLVKD